MRLEVNYWMLRSRERCKFAYDARTMKAAYFCLAVVLAATYGYGQDFSVTSAPSSSASLASSLAKEVDGVYPDSQAFYLNLHENPELSGHETQTATKLAGRLRSLGYDVTEHVGETGIVAILKNGAGPTIMLRTELDALPVEEKTGLAYASKIRTADDSGREVPVMHACGHDLHMASLLGTAAIMAHSKATWHGTLMLI